MLARGKISRFFFNSEDAGAISDVVQDIGDAITDYQVTPVHTSQHALGLTGYDQDITPTRHLQHSNCEFRMSHLAAFIF